jgi:hypothetical protein
MAPCSALPQVRAAPAPSPRSTPTGACDLAPVGRPLPTRQRRPLPPPTPPARPPTATPCSPPGSPPSRPPLGPGAAHVGAVPVRVPYPCARSPSARRRVLKLRWDRALRHATVLLNSI